MFSDTRVGYNTFLCVDLKKVFLAKNARYYAFYRQKIGTALSSATNDTMRHYEVG